MNYFVVVYYIKVLSQTNYYSFLGSGERGRGFVTLRNHAGSNGVVEEGVTFSQDPPHASIHFYLLLRNCHALNRRPLPYVN